ncbi:hypothetical protein MASR1M8_00990 [Thermomonas brevis]
MRRRAYTRPGIALDSFPPRGPGFTARMHSGQRLNTSIDRQDAHRAPLRDHVANSVRRYLSDLDGCDTDDLYNIALRELEIPLFAEVLRHCDGNQSRAAAMLGIHRATLRKKLRDYNMA